jgi:hypothetical protein
MCLIIHRIGTDVIQVSGKKQSIDLKLCPVRAIIKTKSTRAEADPDQLDVRTGNMRTQSYGSFFDGGKFCRVIQTAQARGSHVGAGHYSAIVRPMHSFGGDC